MKKIYTSTIVALCFFVQLSFSQTTETVPVGDKLKWHTNLEEVHKLSQKSHKPIFAFFTGSDWCGWCKKLQRDVFAKKEFIEWAEKNVILMELDFPRGKQLPPELAQQNMNMQQVLGVSGYPTVWIMYTKKSETDNSYNLSTLGQLGYPHDGVEVGNEQIKFLKDANQILSLIPGFQTKLIQD